MEHSKIEWTDHTFNPWIGCTKVSPGCANCYAETQDTFRSWTSEGWGKGKPRRRTSAAKWREPVKWSQEAGKTLLCLRCVTTRFGEVRWKAAIGGSFGNCQGCGKATHLREFRTVRPRVFCASLADWLDDEVPIEWLADLLRLIHDTPNLDWLLLTKRPENWRERIRFARNYLTSRDAEVAIWLNNWLPKSESAGMPAREGQPPHNVWIGTTVEDQERAEERLPDLIEIPAKVRFLSCEPLLGRVNLDYWLAEPLVIGIHWVIAGGESGPNARPMHPDWARSIRGQCQAAGVPFFFKQWGEWTGVSRFDDERGSTDLITFAKQKRFDYLAVPPRSDGFGQPELMYRVGKKAAGRLLDGREWNEFPHFMILNS